MKIWQVIDGTFIAYYLILAYLPTDVIDSMPFRYVSAFLDAKPYAKYMSKPAMTMIQFLKIMKDRY